jgi:N-acetylglucosaminyldiphosphoundecaprenol N-acetyl-beta-D-mannosaminyltransferase
MAAVDESVKLMRREFSGIAIDGLTLEQAVARCVDAVERRSYLAVGVVNAAKIVAMRRNERLRRAVTGCDMVLADGQSVVWACQLLGSPLPQRVAGIDLFHELLGVAARRAYRVYFLGARQDVLDRMLAEVGRCHPGLAVAGARHGYFRREAEPAIVAEIRRSRPDLLFVGMPSPAKELFMSRWGKQTGACVVHGVGGSFDVLAGLTRRAPAWYQKHGLEWLYRARQEPVRLGRRYLMTNFAFMRLVARELVRHQAGRGEAPSHDQHALTALIPPQAGPADQPADARPADSGADRGSSPP